MKNIKYIIAATCVMLFAACQDKGEWDVPSVTAPLYGNNNIQETNVISNYDLIAKYADVIAIDDMKEITEDIQIKGRVTCNDVGGNFYKKITIQDEPTNPADARAITISIDESGIWGYLPIGQEVLIDLKGLWIGGYGYVATIGTPYTSTSNGKTSVGRMSKHLWSQHFKICGDNIKEIEPEVFTKAYMNETDVFTVNGTTVKLKRNAGKLVVFKDVTFKKADGKETLKSGKEAALQGYFIQELTQFSNVQIFTSGDYAKFSTWVLPYDETTEKAVACTLIGIAGYYGVKDVWQISIRQTKDLAINPDHEPAGGDEYDEPECTGTGTLSGNVLTINAADFGFPTGVAATSTKLSDGTKIYFDKGTGSTAPQYYDGTYASVRTYANNTIAIVAAKKISKIEITTTDASGSTKYNGSDNAYAEGGSTKVNVVKESDTSINFSGLNNEIVKITNFADENKGNQLRVKTMVITFAE